MLGGGQFWHHMHIICKTERPAKQLVILAMAHIHYFDECVEEVRARQQHIYILRTYVVSEEETSQLVPTKRSGCMHDTVTVAPNFAIEWTWQDSTQSASSVCSLTRRRVRGRIEWCFSSQAIKIVKTEAARGTKVSACPDFACPAPSVRATAALRLPASSYQSILS
jgi:hypothetical protein